MMLGKFFLMCILALISTSAFAQNFSPATIEMFNVLARQPNDLARYIFLVKTMPTLPAADRPLGMQMFASTEDELGLYNEALRDFPLKSHESGDIELPTASDWKMASAGDVITGLAAGRRIVMINEAHHDAHTRQLTLELLPRLRAIGFNYFAAEALVSEDDALAHRGYPIASSGTEYLREPSYGDIIRVALKLGFTVVSFDVENSSLQEREAGQANNLYKKVFSKDPHARLFVHSGYAHIDKAKGRLGNTLPMATQLQTLTHIEPLSIDQTQFREQIPSVMDAYQKLADTFEPRQPTVLVNRATGKTWSAHPDLYDLNVILPASGSGAVESGYSQPANIVNDMVRTQSMLSHFVNTQRPEWLSLNDERVPLPISTTLCKVTVPCVVDAHYTGESDDAIAADRYAFLQGDMVSKLYLRPGNYRLRAWDIRGHTLSEQNIEVGKR
ncbi:hypothetical protein [Rhodanobacter sp. L36]|uniref:hypothetical protein n=1 Tax=Rhodanobacter sp. L36 TaxID=1747221 RepID=UPI00131B9111|nr:hypothetical protein [Rhodanobacter sp. L36]